MEKISSDSLDLFCTFHHVELARVLSNLIDNACEAISGSGSVHISLSRSGADNFMIRVEDTGKGIAKENLERVFESGVSLGKSGGSGLGLSRAKQVIEKHGGKIWIEPLTHGTAVVIVLKICQAPTWHIGSISVPKHGQIIVADDDDSVHGVWTARFDHKECNVRHFQTPAELSDFVSENRATLGAARFLIDQEFANDKIRGLDLIRQLGIERQSILVTSLYDEDDIMRTCEESNIQLLPKNLVQTIPIEVTV